jgi:nucleoside-diphosphate-sugar epimerase
MTFLITGGCGFIASAFCRRLKSLYPDATIVNVDKLYPCSTVSADLTTTTDKYIFVHADICDTNVLQELLEKYHITTVVHFAAQSHVDTSFTAPLLYTTDNVFGTHSLLEAIRKYGKIQRFVHISTDEVYGENKDSIFDENSLLKPTNPYAASKAAAEMFVHSYMHSYGIPFIIVRSNNVYGPGQFNEKVVPKFILKLLNNEPLTIQGSGNQLRSFLFVEDAVSAIQCIMENGKPGDIYNISSKDEISIRQLATFLLNELKPGESVESFSVNIEDRNFNDKRYWIDSKALDDLGWKQQYTLRDGLLRTIEWYKTCTPSYWRQSERTALVWGSRGWIGGMFKEILLQKGWTVIDAQSRADDRDAVMKEAQLHHPTHIVCLIGRTHGPGYSTIDYLEQSGKLVENVTDNLYGPLTLAGVSRTLKIHMLYMGTGCIFTCESPVDCVGFGESDKPNFFGSGYSTIKGFTDRIMSEEYGTTCLNVRIRMPISSKVSPRNFINKIVGYQNICSIPNSMTVLDDVLPILENCMTNRTVGTLNAVNPGVIEHSTILTWYKELQDPSHEWTEISTDELLKTCVVGQRSNNRLDTTRIQTLYPNIPDIKSSVRTILETHSLR